MAELKPCPFCGNRASMLQLGGRVWVQCLNCLCGTSVHKPYPDVPSLPHTMKECIEQAIAEWNRRDGERDE